MGTYVPVDFKKVNSLKILSTVIIVYSLTMSNKCHIYYTFFF